MAKRYQIWDKKSNIIVPTGKIFTPEEWVEQYPIAGTDIDVVISAGVINGGFFGVYPQMIQMYQDDGCDFTGCESEEECLVRIEEFEDARNAEASKVVSADERIAAALEAQVMMSMPDVDE